MKKVNPITFIKDEIIGSENTFHAWCVVGMVITIIGMGFYLNSTTASFHGVAGSREANVNFESPVEIKRVHVMSGQRVKKGELLLELNQSELDTQIRQTNALIEKLRAERTVRDQMNKAVGNSMSGVDPLSVEIAELENERKYLERQRNNLYVFAEIDGIVGSVNFKRGERAPSFASLVTISPDSPTFVQGFVHEQMRSAVHVGSRVRVSSLTNSAESVEGTVVSVGSRFVEIPYRLAPMAAGNALWGREVMVEINKDSSLLLGEKVQIAPGFSLFSSLVAMADPSANGQKPKAVELSPILLPSPLVDRTSFEASGAVYRGDLHKYLVVSDDTDNVDSPLLFLVSEDGSVEERPLQIPGLKEIEDMESISADQDNVYVMSSLSTKGVGDPKGTRSQLVRFRLRGLDASGTESVQIGKLLRNLIAKSSDPVLRELTRQGLEKLEVEAHSVKDGALYIGLKSPLGGEETSVFLRVPSVNSLFPGDDATPAIEVWKTVKVAAVGKKSQRISDLTFVGDTMYFTTTVKEEKGSAIWSITKDGEPTLVQAFDVSGLEGIAYNPAKNQFFLTFDNGNGRPSEFASVPGPRSNLK